MNKDKIFDGMTFVHSFDEIKNRTKELLPLFEAIDALLFEDEEPTDDTYWQAIIKVAELKDKFVYAYSPFTNNIYVTCNDIDKEGNYIWNEEVPLNNKEFNNLLKELGADDKFIEEFLSVYNDLYTKKLYY